jgi:hypothetical protein
MPERPELSVLEEAARKLTDEEWQTYSEGDLEAARLAWEAESNSSASAQG